RTEFHYCALVNAWQKLGFDDKTCALLCDMAMDGDRGIAEIMGLKFQLGDAIARGHNECKLRFYK
ncbi:MAG: L-2-amino-thiazoline-4-carboxylic acid hydrolase, partial [Spirochaetales bacterium]|nr:L-2-amino-thiazoline-4-carboxylic acid hydrolase [Spirochaetales bacterium]